MKTEATEEGNLCIFRNVPAKYMEGENEYRVYTPAEAAKIDGKPISRFMLREIADDKWSVALILRGLKQGRNYKTYEDRSLESDLDWEKIDKVCIIRIKKNANGIEEREIVEISKDEVRF